MAELKTFEFLRKRDQALRIHNYVLPLFASASLYATKLFNKNLDYLANPYILVYVSIFFICLKFLIENYLVLNRLLCYQRVPIYAADSIYITLDDESIGKYILPIHRSKSSKNLSFILFQLKYIFDSENNKFFVPVFNILNSFKDDELRHLNEEEIKENTEKFGQNKIEIICPAFIDVFISRLFSPNTIFNCFFVILCIAEGYRNSVILSLTMTFLDIFVATINEIIYNRSFKSYETDPVKMKAFRNNTWTDIDSFSIVPGDIIQIDMGLVGQHFPCDMLLLQGSCIVNEAILTGESVPLIKESIVLSDVDENFNFDSRSSANIMFCGTTLLNIDSYEAKNLKIIYNRGIKGKKICICLVIRTNFHTNKGQLFRSLLKSIHQDGYNERETYIYIFLTFTFGLISSIYTFIQRIRVPNVNIGLLIIHCVKLLISAIPTDLSSKMLIFLQRMNQKLKNHNIFTMRISKMPHGGKVDICFFDKTGTLTKDKIILEGVGGLENLSFFDSTKSLEAITFSDVNIKKTITNFKNVKLPTLLSLVGCTSVHKYNGKLLGDPIETATLKIFKCNLQEDSIKCSFPFVLTVKVLKRFPFISELRRMSCYVIVQNQSYERGYEYACAVKGAPESMRSLFHKLPSNYDETANIYSSQGYRVLALGYKSYEIINHDFTKLARSDLESNLIFCGFLLARSSIKSDCVISISNLHKMCVETAMISGDSPLTACYVSRDIGIFYKPAIILYYHRTTNMLFWKGYGFNFDEKFDYESLNTIESEYQLCITGDALKHLQTVNNGKLKHLILKSKVFARFDPHQKEYVIKIFKSMGFVTLMCGDGANDIGALRVSDIGIAMINKKKECKEMKKEIPIQNLTHNKIQNNYLNKLKTIDMEEIKPGDASVAAPFTFKGSELARCVNFLKFCNCSLVYFQHIIIISTVYCVQYVYMQATHYSAGLIFSEKQQIYYGVMSLVIYYATFQTTPTLNIPNIKPVKSLFHPYICLSILFQSIIHTFTIYFLSNNMGIDFPIPDPLQENQFDILKNFKPSDFNTLLLYYEFFVMLAIYTINYCGSPFCAPIKENRLFLVTVAINYICIFLTLFNMCPYITSTLQITVLSREISIQLFIVILFNFWSAFLADYILYFIFIIQKSSI